MTVIQRALRDGIRATLLLRPRGNPALASASTFLVALLAYLLLESLGAYLSSEGPREIQGWGLLVILSDTMLTLAAAWVLVWFSGRKHITWGVASIAVFATAMTSVLVHWPLMSLASWLYRNGLDAMSMFVAWLSFLWWFPVLLRLATWLAPKRLFRSILAAMLAYAVSAAPWWWLPNASVIVQVETDLSAGWMQDDADQISGTGFDGSADENGEFLVSFDPEAVIYAQPRLLQSAIDSLTPRQPGKPNLFVVAFAGDGGEDVFRNEVEFVEQLFSQRFDASGHVLVLENNPATVETRPLATLTNLRLALTAIAERMDPAEDILMLYLTSHGSREHDLYVSMDPLPLNQISPEALAETLETEPSMRWKVMIVNACYSGGFIDALRDDSTMVITAARSDRTSFGCGTESEITYFGKAFLAEALNETRSLREAFDLAKAKVDAWEERDQEEKRSEPQIASSRSIESKLDSWRKTLPEAATVEFTPAASIPRSPLHDGDLEH
ncbi:C13 family peptidase [Dokdonella sp.]|uniref:C13 family peptidase n=1 Tax=Dokdonella sp. TaxID=2291710 RepID=UPI003C53F9A1